MPRRTSSIARRRTTASKARKAEKSTACSRCLDRASPSLRRPAMARTPVHAAGSGPFCVPAPASSAFKEADGAKGAGTKRSAARGAPAWPGADALAQMGQVQMAPAPAGKGKEARRSPAPWLPQAPEDSRRSPFESARVRSSPLAPAQVSWSPQAGTPTPLSLPSAQDSAQDSAQNSAQGSAQDVALGRWLRSVPWRPRPWHKLMPAGSSGQEAPGEGRGFARGRRARGRPLAPAGSSWGRASPGAASRACAGSCARQGP